MEENLLVEIERVLDRYVYGWLGETSMGKR